MKIGKDKMVRFTTYRVIVIHLEDYRMGIYCCDYNFLRNVALNEECLEYHYQDVVSVTTKEESSCYILPTGQKFTRMKMFRISVSSEESVGLAVGSSEYRLWTNERCFRIRVPTWL